MRSTLLVASVALAACASSRSQTQGAIPTPSATSAAPAPGVLPFIEDDYPSALAQAKAQGKPLFVDAWAPW